MTYNVVPTGRSVRVGDAVRPTYRAERWTVVRGGAPQRAGGSGDLVDFDVTAFEAGGAGVVHRDAFTQTPARVHLALAAVAAAPARRAGDQAAAAPVTTTRHARTVRIAAAAAQGGSPPVDTSRPAGIPRLPGDA